ACGILSWLWGDGSRRESFTKTSSLGGQLRRAFLWVLGTVVIAGVLVDGYAVRQRRETDKEFQNQVALARAEAERIRAQVVLPTTNKIPAGENFAAALQNLGLSEVEAAGATAAAQSAFNLRQLRAGNTIAVGRSVLGELREINYKIDPDRVLHIVPDTQGFSAEVREIPSHLEVEVVSGRLEDSLFNAVEDAGESPEVALRLAQIFGYDLDFYTDPRKGDTFRVVIEKKKYSDGETAAYGRILAAEYDNGGKKYQALLFHDDRVHSAYYAADGKSLQKAFLRSPLKFAAPVTSHFSKARFHPILKTYRPHLGTDYGAPVGTPVQTIGSGRVEFAGRMGGDGNMVKVSHAQGYETMYLHLSKIFVHPGEHVEIGKTIGLVGMTGLATGPHLDFRILKKGQFLNFEKLGLPPSEPVSKKNWAEFAAVREKWVPVLENPEQLQSQIAQTGAGAR
ncbi:MAG TPA: peptidoglycan DD-metalloendopeptidase family protein, partial [Candidatus Sulfotelmatobacter sp.]|nr:peptidoglycan DD-metalloendopeptidase family protein [Candidatus Sulfotelmatobacter sp.]